MTDTLFSGHYLLHELLYLVDSDNDNDKYDDDDDASCKNIENVKIETGEALTMHDMLVKLR